MLKRLSSSLLLWLVIIVAVVCWKSAGIIFLLSLLGVLASYEGAVLFGKFFIKAVNPLLIAIVSATALTLTALYPSIHICSIVFTIAIFALFIFRLITSGKTKIIEALQEMASFAFLSLISVLLSYYIFILQILREASLDMEGCIFILWILAVVKFSDVGGYAVGSGFGRHKIIPKISPGKSWEGLVGGLVSSAVISVCMVAMLGRFFPDNFTMTAAALWALPLGLLGFFSDLIESYLKRKANAKDSGNMIPGIGGALDLCDSLLLTAPLGSTLAIFYFHPFILY